MREYTSKIGLGTVQWGLEYGISNVNGITPHAEARKILKNARHCGINTIDTAYDYGIAEKVLGVNDISGFMVCTKIPSAKGIDTEEGIKKHFESYLNSSLKNLKKDRVEYLLLHDCNDLLGNHHRKVAFMMNEYKNTGKAIKVGFSAYSSDQIKSAIKNFAPDIVQVPFSILDRRLLESGILKELKDRDIEVHARSIFLQGLLLMKPTELDRYFDPFLSQIRSWHELCRKQNAKPLDLALYYAVSQHSIDKCIIGISTLDQLKEAINSLKNNRFDIDPHELTKLGQMPKGLLNPSLWNLE